MVAKLSGFAKFDVDHKLNIDQFVVFIMNQSNDSSGFSEAKFNEIVEIMEKVYVEGATPFAGDLENETYKAILQAIRDFNMSEAQWGAKK